MTTRTIFAMLTLAATAIAQPKLQLKVHHGVGQVGYDVNSTMISGQKDMLVTVPYLTLEGEQFPVTGPVPGSDGAGNSFVFVPSLKAVITGDIVFDRVYFGVPRDKAREDWTKTIDQILALKPEIVVPGHEGAGATRNVASIEFMKKYIADWDKNVAKSKTPAEMRTNVLKQYSNLGMEFTLNDRIATFFPAPGKGK